MKDTYINLINKELKDFEVRKLRMIYHFCIGLKGIERHNADSEKVENKVGEEECLQNC